MAVAILDVVPWSRPSHGRIALEEAMIGTAHRVTFRRYQPADYNAIAETEFNHCCANFARER